MENHATPGTPPNPIAPRPAGTRRVSRLVVVALVLFALLAMGAWIYLAGPRGMRGKVQSVLSGVRSEEKRFGAGSRRMNPGLRMVTDLIDKVLPTRRWQGEYYYRQKLVELGTNAVPELMRAIETDPSVAARKVSAMALGELSGPGVLPCLTKVLAKDKDHTVRQAAAEALAGLDDPKAVPALMTALRADQDQRVRAECARAVGNLGGQAVVPELIAVSAKETNATVRARLAATLGELQDRRSVPLLVTWIHAARKESVPPTNGVVVPEIDADEFDFGSDAGVASAAATALGNVGGEEAFRALMSQCGTETNEQIQTSLCEALGVIGDPRALPALLAALREETASKSSVVEALGNLGDTNAVAELRPLLGDGDREVRRKTAEALGQIGGPACVPELMRVAEQDYAAEVRLGACAALGMFGDAQAQEVIIRALPQLGNNRQEAVWALGHVGDTNAISTLAGLLDDKERETRFAAAYALAEIGGAAAAEAVAAHLEDKDEYARHGKACALAMLGRINSLAGVRAGLRAKELWRRFGAALALLRLGGAVDAKEWQPMRADRSAALQHLAAEAAAWRGVSALTGLLDDRDKNIRHYAARGIIFFKDPSTLPALRVACHDSHPEVRNAARATVRCLERSAGSRN